MESKKTEFRGIPFNQLKLWNYSIEKENQLRLKWFKKNESRLNEIVNEEHLRRVPEEVKEEMKQRMLNYFEKGEKKKKMKVEIEPAIVDEGGIRGIMKPVEKEVLNLLYTNVINEGRKTYLKERFKVIPEHRYYFPETTSFRYGWNMWELSKQIRGSPFARQQVIKESFYRRRGVDRDPEWYREPARLSPQICGRI